MPPAASSSKKTTPTLRLLTTRLKEVQTSFNDIWSYVQGFDEGDSAIDVEVRLEEIDDLWERFCETLIEIKAHDDYTAQSETYEGERQEVSNRYYKAKSFLKTKVKERQAPFAMEQTIRVGETSLLGTLDHVRLPQIKLQTFDGNIDEWLSFRDLFTSLIHWKVELPEVEKFHYLKGCLQGEPKGLIDSLKLTAANYQVAWDTLLKRYDNSKHLKKRQVQSLFKLPALTKESVGDLRSLLEGFEKIVQTLDQVVQPADYKDLLLVNLLTSRLDPATCRSWEEFSSTKEQDYLKELTEFLHRRIRVLESLPSRTTDARVTQSQSVVKLRPQSLKHSFASTQANETRCKVCNSSHMLYQCPSFQKMTISERESLIRSYALCRNCLKSGHIARDCDSKYSCRYCKGRHHSMVCFRNDKAQKQKTTSNTSTNLNSAKDVQQSATPTTALNAASTSKRLRQFSSTVLLATAVVLVEDDYGIVYPARALLDSGSESNFVSERLTQRMKIKRNKVDVSVSGIAQACTRIKHCVYAKVKSRVTEFEQEMKFLVLPKVTVNLPTATVDISSWHVPKGIQLADPSFFLSSGVDLVLGVESFFDFFVTGKRMALGNNFPMLNDSVFGWIICGGLSARQQPLHVVCNFSASEALDALIAKFWACEELDDSRTYSPEERKCEELFVRTTQRGKDGRYTVYLPKNEVVLAQLGSSKSIAFRRLQGTERRLARDANLRKEYVAFMKDYLQLGHMRPVEEAEDGQSYRCFLPHHPVIKESSSTTKVRVVFDASCKTSSSRSLNDALLVGPVIQQDLRAIILRSRTRQVMLVADVEKMFRQINVAEEDRRLQSILWRESINDKVQTYELNTVTYGTKPAPFLATRTLSQLAVDEQNRFPFAVQAVKEDTYMDDVITGASYVEETINLRIQLHRQNVDKGWF